MDTKMKKQEQCTPWKYSKMGPLLVMMMVFTTPIIAANLLRMVWWPDGVVCAHCEKSSHIKKRANIGNVCRDTTAKITKNHLTTKPGLYCTTNMSDWASG